MSNQVECPHCEKLFAPFIQCRYCHHTFDPEVAVFQRQQQLPDRQLAIREGPILVVELSPAEISDLVTYLTQVNAHSYVGMLICKGLSDEDNVARYKLQMVRAQNLNNKFSEILQKYFRPEKK